MEIVLTYKWLAVDNGLSIPYQFPQEISTHFRANWGGPAVYRWVISKQEPGHLPRLYVGETDLLPRRVNGYLNPGPSQRTNQRLKAEFEKELESGHKVTLEALSFEPFHMDRIPISMSHLNDKAVRRFLEAFFTLYYSKCGCTLLNL